MFDSKAKKQEKDYQYLVKILKSSNIDTLEKVDSYRKNITPKALYASIAILIMSALLSLLLNKYYPIWGIIAVLCLAWVWASALTTKKIMIRYVKEELSKETNKEARL